MPGTQRFAPAPAPSDLEVARLLASVRRRIVRLVARHGIGIVLVAVFVVVTEH